MPETARYRIGVDENGLGPRLGPMIVTAVLARATEEGFKLLGKAPRGALAKRLGDSKKFVSYGDTALGEAWARTLVERSCGRFPVSPATPDALINALATEGVDGLKKPCPTEAIYQCFHTKGETFSADPKLLTRVGEDLDRLRSKGVDILAVRSVVLCAKRMNDAADQGKNRFVVDLHAMENLILELQAVANADVFAVCGKVGGFGKYSTVFGPLGGRLHSVIVEGRGRSQYRFPGIGDVSFVQDSDASDVCVAMASMVGKYVREVLMGRVSRYYADAVPDLDHASGYHDPVTTSFIKKTRLIRRNRNIPDACFERRKVDSTTR